jgi:uncharacterized protein (DUF4213/DUF364 family)
LNPTVPVPPITEEYVRLAERIAQRLGRPRVRALHLPSPRAAPKDAEFCALELEDGSVGFSFVRLGTEEASLRLRHGADACAGMEAAALARGYAGTDPAATALGFAAINALSQHLFARAGWVPPAADDSLGDLAPAPGEHVGMIGLFRPLIGSVSAAGARLTVLELRPELAGEHENYRVTLDAADLAGCDKVVSTCTVMLNDTLDAVLAACRNARYIAIVGPTAGCVPDPLFARGVDAIGGRRVVDARAFLDAFRNGEKWGAFAAKYVIARQAYPGVDGLMARLA